MGAQVASANTSVTLYVSSTGTVTTGCTSPGTGPCKTIQEGVTAAEAYSSSDVTVEVAAGTYDENDTIAVPSGDTLTLQGAGASTTTADGGNDGSSVFAISSGTATIDGFTITGGESGYDIGGGGVYNDGTATLTDDTISADSALRGGGVYNDGTATLSDDTLSGDFGHYDAGGVYSDGALIMTDDTLSGDSALDGAGGGILSSGTATLTDDTLSGDSAAAYGGGILNAGTATLTNDTISNDSWIGVYSDGTTTLTEDTISNDIGGGVDNNTTGAVTVSNSILDAAPCSGTITDGGYNVESDDSCGFGSTDVVNSLTINLASSLAANGSSGPETLAIGSNSSAFEEVPSANCSVTTDERGDPRPGVPSQNCDAGAFEYQASIDTIHYSANTGTGSASATTGLDGTTVTLSGGGSIALSGYTLAGWCTTQPSVGATCGGTAYSLGQTGVAISSIVTTPGGSATLYAVWTAPPGPPTPIPTPTPTATQIYGVDAIGTSIAISEAEYPTAGSAKAVVLARDDFFSDALTGGPLAAAVDGPLLITEGAPISSTLDPRVQAEIERVLPKGGTVYILGGDLALSPNIDATLEALGYIVIREAGIDEYATAVDLANAIATTSWGTPSIIFEATGLYFFDALSAGPAAIKEHAAILLTDGSTQSPETAAYLAEHPGDTRYAIGGPLAALGADPTAIGVYGQDLFNTSAAVASYFFPNPSIFGVATAADFPDALGGGVFMATGGRLGPILLVNPSTPLPPEIVPYLNSLAVGTQCYVFGGPLAVGADVLAALQAAVG